MKGLKTDVYYCISCQKDFSVGPDQEPQYCPFCAEEVSFSHSVDPDEEVNFFEQDEEFTGFIDAIIKDKYWEFIEIFLSDEPDTERVELLPNFWVVTNEKNDFYATIECEFQVRDFRTLEKQWFAVVTVGNEKSYFLLDVKTETLDKVQEEFEHVHC